MLMLWYIVSPEAFDRLFERMQHPKITRYFDVKVETATVAQSDDELIKCFLGLPFA